MPGEDPPLNKGELQPEEEQKQGARTSDAIEFFRSHLLIWAADHGRTFPWRETADPYRILIAEMMLRRTQARQVVPVYHTFLERFPRVKELADADEDEVSRLLRPLGLAWRAENFRQMAQEVMAQEGGHIPLDRERLLSLTGVGDYVASAVRCMAFGIHEALIDTNTVRVSGRYLGFPTHAESRRNRVVRSAVTELIEPATPRDSNLALLDFAALICRAPRPLCEQCPMTMYCAWFKANQHHTKDHSGDEYGPDTHLSHE